MAMHLSLDIGQARVGVALSDRDGRLARAYETFPRAQGRAESLILELLEEQKVGKIVIGLPLGEGGQYTEQCEDVARFARRLSRRTDLPLIFVDEYLSSERAKKRLDIQGSPTQEIRKKGVIDAQAASIILQEFLDGIAKVVTLPENNT